MHNTPTEALARHAVQLDTSIRALQQTLSAVKQVLQLELTRSIGSSPSTTLATIYGDVTLAITSRREIDRSAMKELVDAGDVSLAQVVAMARFTVAATRDVLGLDRTVPLVRTKAQRSLSIRATAHERAVGVERSA
ncbi:MAG: hypothetical protein H7Z43_02620 [Clostridia bacterium]|nr:hypothetical protein [Deltaproteobacteria bacterium]